MKFRYHINNLRIIRNVRANGMMRWWMLLFIDILIEIFSNGKDYSKNSNGKIYLSFPLSCQVLLILNYEKIIISVIVEIDMIFVHVFGLLVSRKDWGWMELLHCVAIIMNVLLHLKLLLTTDTCWACSSIKFAASKKV